MLSVGILVFDDVEILDFCGPYEVFSTAARVHARRHPAHTLFRCFLIADQMRPLRSRGGMKVLPDCALLPSADIDVLIVPGGDVSKVIEQPHVIDWIRTQSRDTTITASVCTGAFLLAKAGLLDGLNATTHWEDQDELGGSFPAVSVRRNGPWIDCGKVVTWPGTPACWMAGSAPRITIIATHCAPSRRARACWRIDSSCRTVPYTPVPASLPASISPCMCWRKSPAINFQRRSHGPWSSICGAALEGHLMLKSIHGQ